MAPTVQVMLSLVSLFAEVGISPTAYAIQPPAGSWARTVAAMAEAARILELKPGIWFSSSKRFLG